jgi:glycopeptide antibiotics resistance protein
MIEETEKRAKLTAILGIALFVTVPLSYFSSIIFASLHPQINPIPDQPGFIYWDPIKIFSLIFNLIGITLLFVYLLIQFTKVEKSKEKLNKIIQRKLEGE